MQATTHVFPPSSPLHHEDHLQTVHENIEKCQPSVAAVVVCVQASRKKNWIDRRQCDVSQRTRGVFACVYSSLVAAATAAFARTHIASAVAVQKERAEPYSRFEIADRLWDEDDNSSSGGHHTGKRVHGDGGGDMHVSSSTLHCIE